MSIIYYIYERLEELGKVTITSQFSDSLIKINNSYLLPAILL